MTLLLGGGSRIGEQDSSRNVNGKQKKLTRHVLDIIVRRGTHRVERLLARVVHAKVAGAPSRGEPCVVRYVVEKLDTRRGPVVMRRVRLRCWGKIVTFQRCEGEQDKLSAGFAQNVTVN